MPPAFGPDNVGRCPVQPIYFGHENPNTRKTTQMCGIAGFYHLERDKTSRPDLLKRMTDTLIHRGPDGEGYFQEGQVALGHRRLAIIDLQSGQQPMYRQNRELVLVFNGEIYNYLELRDDLKKLGHEFISSSDSEVILAAYQQWGTACVSRLNGMWAFALWDARQKRLFCSRDRAGEKPFFYTVVDGTFVFGSEPKVLFEFGLRKKFDLQHLEAYLCFGYVPGPDSLFENVRKLEAGHNLIVSDGAFRAEEYWDVDFTPDPTLGERPEETREKFAELFADSVRLRMRADVPFGAFLSGGLDSASVVSVMPSFSNEPVSTFTIGFQEQAFDERGLAKLVAAKFLTQHTETVVSLDSGIRSIDFLSKFFDEPFGDSSALPTYWVSNQARKHVTMVLTGDAGDEVLSGYPVHQSEKIATLLSAVPSGADRALIGGLQWLGLVTKSSRVKRVTKLYETARLPLGERIVQKQNSIPTHIRNELLDRRYDIVPPIEYVDRILKRRPEYNQWNKLNYWLFKASLAEDMLVKVDRASMANSLETRVPFLDYRLVELLAKIPERMKMPRLVRKDLLRRSVAKRLPSELLRAPKRGFTAPESALNLLQDDGVQIKSRLRALISQLPIRPEAIERLILNPDAMGTNAWWTLLMLSSVANGAKV